MGFHISLEHNISVLLNWNEMHHHKKDIHNSVEPLFSLWPKHDVTKLHMLDKRTFQGSWKQESTDNTLKDHFYFWLLDEQESNRFKLNCMKISSL